jgi:hypothetical protein
MNNEHHTSGSPVHHLVGQDLFSAGGCPTCGDDILGTANPDGTFNDGASLNCTGCKFVGWVNCDDAGAHLGWYDVEVVPSNVQDNREPKK